MTTKSYVRNAGSAVAALAVLLSAASPARASVSITAATGGGAISADTAATAASPAWTTLGPIVITEGVNGDFVAGTNVTLVLKTPAGFEYNSGAAPDISFTADRNITAASVAMTDASTMTITLTVSGIATNDVLTIGGTSGVQVRPTAGTPLATGNHIYRPTSGGGSATITGITTSTTGSTGSNFGNLTEVVGAATVLVFTTQPAGSVYGSALATQPVVRSRDQFGNNSSAGLGATNMVTLTLNGPGAIVGTSSLNIGTSGGNGLATFTGLQVNSVGTGDTITASATGVTSATSTAFNITAKALTVTGATASSKVYDATTVAALNLGSAVLSGVVSWDTGNVTLDTTAAAGSFATKTIGTSKPVTVTGLALAGSAAGNYTLTAPALTASITAKGLTVSGVVALDKVYNRSTVAALDTTAMALVGAIGGDVVNLGGTPVGAFASVAVGTNKTVTITGLSISGTDSGNYTFTPPSSTATITPFTLTVGATATSRVYNATTSATVTLTDNRFSGDTISFSSSAAFEDKTVGTNKTVNVTGIAISGGSAAGNYVLGNTTTTATANITALALAVTVTTANKVYDGTTAATGTLAYTPLTGDSVTVNYTNAAFSTSAVGTRTATFSGLYLTGADGGNYSVAASVADAANITAKAITVTGVTASDKVYDGTAAATINTNALAFVGLIEGDAVSAGGTPVGTFADKNVGTNKVVSVTGLTLSGASAGNYTLTQPSTTASITQATLTVTATGVSRVYNGTNTATVTLANNHYGTDSVTVTYASALFDDKLVGSNKTVSVTGIAITGGTAAGNYVLGNASTTTTANITALALAVTATAANKVYDGTTAATGTLAYTPVVGDSVTVTYTSGTFSSSAVGSRTATFSGLTLSGADAGNYSVAASVTDAANITAKAITVTGVTASDKVYDGTTAATINTNALAFVGLIEGDAVSAGGTPVGTFADKNVGTNKVVAVTGLTLSGASAGNYTLTQPSTAASITPATLTVTATGVNRVYNGTNTATVTLANNHYGTDSVTVTYASALFDDKLVGSNKTVSVTGIAITGGTAAGNYVLGNASTTTTANITALALAVTATAANKVYDGTTAATGTLAYTPVAGDSVTVTYTSGTFSSSAVGTRTATFSGLTLSGADAGNYSVAASVTDSASITAKAITVTGVTANDKVYDGTTAATVNTNDLQFVGLIEGDAVSAGGTPVGTFADKNVGTNKVVAVTGLTLSGASAANYTLTQPSTSASITQATLTVTATGVNRVYNGTNTATVTLANNHYGTDSVTVTNAPATFADKTVGTNKTVTVTGIGISGGTAAGNYVLGNTTASTTANITPLALAVTATTSDKVYDGTTAATGTLAYTPLVGDSVTVTYTNAAFASSAVGTQSATFSGLALTGADAGNYSVAASVSDSAHITAKPITVAGVTASDKVYDGATTATVITNAAALVGVVNGDTVNLGGTAAGAFSDKNVGTNKSVTISGMTLSGAQSGNYTLTQPTGVTASITPATLTVTATATSRVYNGTMAATVTLANNHFGSDAVTVTYTNASFADKMVATNKTVTVSGIAITGGAAAGNYVLGNTTATATANITAATLTVTATAAGKVYDGTTAATATLADNRIAGDVLTVTYTNAVFNSALVGNRTATMSGLAISGLDAGNYVLAATTASDAAAITAKALTITGLTASNRVYNATTTATVITNGASLAGVVSGDTVAFTGAATGVFADKNVGPAKIVTVSGLSLSGASAAQYTLTTPTTVADITPATLTVTATGVSKVYDGTTAATVTLANNKLGTDVVTNSYASANFADKIVGTGKPVSVSGIAIAGGVDAANYVIGNTTAATTASITAKALAVTATAADKVYDGTTAATVTLSDSRAPGDVLTVTNASATFANKNIGTGKTVSVSGISASGIDATNYTVNATASTTASITAKALTVSGILASNKVYNATAAAALNTASAALVGVIAGDTVTLNKASAVGVFADKHAGPAKTVNVSGLTISGSGAGNYTLTQPAATADITPASLAVTAAGVNKSYDGTTAATVNYSDNRISNDVFSITGSASFGTPDAGNGKAISITDIALTGLDGGNYTPNTTASATANIVAIGLTARAEDKTMTVGDTVPALTVAYTGFVNGETEAVLSGSPSLATAATSSSPAGDYPITIEAGTLSSANYSVNFVPGTLSVLPPDALFYDGFVRAAEPGSLAPWIPQSGQWGINASVMHGTNQAAGAGLAYITNSWSNYALEARVLFGANPDGAGISGYLDTTTGSRYAARVYTEGGSNVLKLVKFTDWTTASYAPGVDGVIAQAALPAVGSDWHTMKLAFLGTQITVSFDGAEALSASDLESSHYTNGAVALDMASLTLPGIMAVEYALVTPEIKIDQAITFGTLADATYGDAPMGLSATASSGLAVSFSVVSGPASLGSSTLTITGAGTVTVRAAQAGNSIYNAAPHVDRSFVVQPAALTVAGDNKSRVYGDVNPSLTGAVTGLVNGDVITADFSSVATAASDAGDYAILPLLNDPASRLGNYTVTTNAGTLAIGKASLTVTPFDEERDYGDPNPAFSGVISGIKNSDNITAVYGSAAGLTSPVGYHPITASLVDLDSKLGNYNVTLNEGQLTVFPVWLTIQPDNQSRAYGDANPALTCSLIGLRNGDAISANGSALADAASAVGDYEITASLSDPDNKSGNYVLVYNTGTLTVSARAVTVTADAKSKAYGDADPALTAQVTAGSLVNGDSLTGSFTRVAGESVGTYAIQQGSLALSANYTLTFASADLSITARPVTVTADAKSKVYGDADPALTAQVTSGSLVNGDSLTGSLTRAAGESVGTYAIQQGSLALSANYTLTFVPANLTITALPPTTVGIRDNGDNTVTVTFSGSPNGEYVVQAGSDLAATASWGNVSTNTAGTDGKWSFTESKTGHQMRFYRSALP